MLMKEHEDKSMGSTATTAFPTEAGHGKQNNIVQMKAHPE